MINKRAGIILLVVIVVFALLKFYANYKKYNRDRPQTEQTFNRKTGHLILTRHARCRMQCRDISEQEINEILRDGEIDYNKSELNEARGPRYALEGYSHEHQHLRVIFAPENDDIVVVTCIDLDKEWPCSCD
jgi:Domain of unknown function (DUF4258)